VSGSFSAALNPDKKHIFMAFKKKMCYIWHRKKNTAQIISSELRVHNTCMPSVPHKTQHEAPLS
jgi:hypothetical protein